jgi:glycosyltransferase involved in cell wall biosynthesis
MRQIQDSITTHKLQDRVLCLGSRSDDEVTDRLRRAAVFAMPSVAEGLGLSLQEAQFHGCACVASRAGGITDLIQDGDNGLLVPVAQPAALATALERLMSDEPLRARFAARGHQSVLEKGMTAAKMVENYQTLYADILGRA